MIFFFVLRMDEIETLKRMLEEAKIQAAEERRLREQEQQRREQEQQRREESERLSAIQINELKEENIRIGKKLKRIEEVNQVIMSKHYTFLYKYFLIKINFVFLYGRCLDSLKQELVSRCTLTPEEIVKYLPF